MDSQLASHVTGSPMWFPEKIPKLRGIKEINPFYQMLSQRPTEKGNILSP